MNKSTSKVFLIPIPLSEGALHTIPESVQAQSIKIKHYFVENIRTARRYLKSISKSVDIDAIHFSEINQKSALNKNLLKEWIENGFDIGVMSEAGCPGIADPGAEVIAYAQNEQVEIIPLVGPNSILLALMGSGFNGQRFRFLGYLPVKESERVKSIKELETSSKKEGETQIFIETPYRNEQLFESLLKNCQANTKLCIAIDLTSGAERIQTKTIAAWKKEDLKFHKIPAIFLLQA